MIHLLLCGDIVKAVLFYCDVDLSDVYSAINASLHRATNTMDELSFHV